MLIFISLNIKNINLIVSLMGVLVNICDADDNNYIIKSYDVDIKKNIIPNIDKNKFDTIIKIIKKLFIHSYFIKLKNYHKEEILINNNIIKKEIDNKNNNNLKHKKEIQEEENNNIEKKEKLENQNNESINDNKSKKINNIIPKNNDSILNSTMNIKSINNNEDNTVINETNTNEKNKDKEKDKSLNNPENIFNNTPNPELQNITPMGNYDKASIPGELIFNFNDIPLNDEILKVENDLGEFIIDNKELIKYMEQYPYVPKIFSIRYPSGEKYSGYFSPNWEKEIFGIQINPNGSKYVGLFKNGMYDGRGRLIFRKGDYFEGEFKNNKANGFGKYVNINGEIYIGNWVNDKQEGKGELILKNGSRYIGEFKNGMENGKGKIIWNDSSFYEGDFVDNNFEGYGIYMMRNKKNYIGQWKMGQMNGFGIFNYPDGKSYKGYFENDKKNGFGIYSGKNNMRYEGKYKKGRQYGIGRIINEKGERQLGLYLKGKRLKLLNEKDFKEDIINIDKEIEKIHNIINNNEFFVKNIGQLEIIQSQYFGTTTQS